jgi:alpha-aminoadipic semialdehyde synthase
MTAASTRAGGSVASSANATDLAGGSTASFTGRKKRVLILGSGMVAKPAVDHIASRKDVELVVGA